MEELLNAYGRERKPCLFVLDYELQHPLVWPLDDVPSGHVWYDLGGRTNVPPLAVRPDAFSFSRFPVPFEEFRRKFRYVHDELLAGNSFLTNLTVRTRVETSLSFREIFQRSQARYKLYIDSLPEGNPCPPFVCFSPEIFVRIEGNRIASYPMKGTMDATRETAAEELLADEKERFEHATIVDLIRNDLARITTTRWVERFRYLEEIRTNGKPLLQASSEIAGTLPEGWQNQLGTLLARLLPAGSITGAPKPKTMDIIREAEGEPRGYYTGIVGLFDGKNLDTGVLIRFLEQRDDGLWFRSGGGITFLSEAEKEYQEVIDKVYLPILS
ncbi:aminodeoxychorismate synthase component I [Siphonobacter aquaeclarae]|uniref:Aminodeoxychorismate synthase, subunit I n=1 Tax=Siphonobacter aquaeclarae TaxID=563176 RepID=A0A1G9UK31_9BACT|nr:aminodeoxychorismate synthase component I [Siphonobacter aquaeclarae]SDM60246.1 aminodeoxychorismate synthase, subunit I [Siphonobacter aquaeclarae]